LAFVAHQQRCKIVELLTNATFRILVRMMAKFMRLRMTGEPSAPSVRLEYCPLYKVREEVTLVTMPDGVRLSTTHCSPQRVTDGEDSDNNGNENEENANTEYVGPVILIRTPYSMHMGILFAHVFAQRGMCLEHNSVALYPSCFIYIAHLPVLCNLMYTQGFT
jgi:predicted acyl esterase